MFQALYRQAKKKGLTRFLHKDGDKEVKRLMKLMIVLPRLPASEIRPAFESIKVEADNHLRATVRRKMEKLFKYFHSYWLTQVSPKALSVCDKNVVVTSGLESINARINDLMPMKHPQFWLFLGESHYLQLIKWSNSVQMVHFCSLKSGY